VDVNSLSEAQAEVKEYAVVQSLGEFMSKVFLAGLMTTLLAVFLAASTVLSPPGLNAQAPKMTKDAMVHAGQDLFAQKCMQCHSVIEGQAMFGPSLYREMKKPTGSAPNIRLVLKNGKGKMPSFQDKLTPEDTNNLLAYLHTL
jgi:mono/diheme cytochrome c family protein